MQRPVGDAGQAVEAFFTKAAPGFQSRRGRGHEPTPVTPHYAKRDVMQLLDVVRGRGAPIMANRVLAAVRKFFAWCVSRGLLDTSPCAGVAAPARERSRYRVLDDDQLTKVLLAARDIGPPFGSIVW